MKTINVAGYYVDLAMLVIAFVLLLFVLGGAILFTIRSQARRESELFRQWVPRKKKLQEKFFNTSLVWVCFTGLLLVALIGLKQFVEKPSIAVVLIDSIIFFTSVFYGVSFDRWYLKINEEDPAYLAAVHEAERTKEFLSELVEEIVRAEENESDPDSNTLDFLRKRIKTEKKIYLNKASETAANLWPLDQQKGKAKAFIKFISVEYKERLDAVERFIEGDMYHQNREKAETDIN